MPGIKGNLPVRPAKKPQITGKSKSKADGIKKSKQTGKNNVPDLVGKVSKKKKKKDKPKIVKSVLKFSPSSMLFRIDASPVQENFEQRDTIKIENTGQFPIEVKFKTSFPFSILVHQSQPPVEEWSYDFAAEEIVRLTINFDGRHLRKDRGSVIFDSTLITTKLGVPHTETIPLRGEVYFPTLDFSGNKIDFGSIVNGTEAVEEFQVSNPGVFCLAYKWYIQPGSTVIEFEKGKEEENDEDEEFDEDLMYGIYSFEDEVEEEEEEETDYNKEEVNIVEIRGIKDEASDSANHSANHSANESQSQEDNNKMDEINTGEVAEEEEELNENLEDDGEDSGRKTITDLMKADSSELDAVPQTNKVSSGIHCGTERSADSSQHSLDLAKDANETEKVVGEELLVNLADLDEADQLSLQQSFRSKMLGMLGLADANEEIEDEFNYLSFNRNTAKYMGPILINEVIDIIPLSGIMSAGNSQTFTVVFYGHPNIRFKTTAICHIEGGTSKRVTIIGSCCSNHLIIPRSFCESKALKMTTDRADGEEVEGVPVPQNSVMEIADNHLEDLEIEQHPPSTIDNIRHSAELPTRSSNPPTTETKSQQTTDFTTRISKTSLPIVKPPVVQKSKRWMYSSGDRALSTMIMPAVKQRKFPISQQTKQQKYQVCQLPICCTIPVVHLCEEQNIQECDVSKNAECCDT